MPAPKPVLKTRTRHPYWVYTGSMTDSFGDPRRHSFPEGKAGWDGGLGGRSGSSIRPLHGDICPVINGLQPGDVFELAGESIVETRDGKGRLIDTQRLGTVTHRFQVEMYTPGVHGVEPYKIAWRIA